MLIYLVLPLFTCVVNGVRAASCADKLVTHETTRTTRSGNVVMWQLQFCCEVDSIWIAPFDGVWSLDDSQKSHSLAALEKAGVSSPYTYAVCPDGRTISGIVHKEQECDKKVGAVVPLMTYNEHLPFEVDRWYTICYKYSDGCSVCSIDVFCAHDAYPECEELWLKHRVVDIMNDSLTLNVEMGSGFPLSGDLKVILFEQHLQGPAIEIERSLTQAKAGSALSFTSRKQLRENNYYVFQICFETIPTSAFKTKYGIDFADKPQVICRNATSKTGGGHFLGLDRSSGEVSLRDRNSICASIFAIIISFVILR